jgi:hypothetical protein
MNLLHLAGWFVDAALPGTTPDPVVILGGTGLLREFMSVAGSWVGGGQLSIATPYIGQGIAKGILPLRDMDHTQIDLLVVTQTKKEASCAYREIGSFPWRSLAICLCPGLHAKIYAFVPRSVGGVSLVGSHNLTRAGAGINDEAGVLFLSRSGSDICRMILICHDRISELAGVGEKLFDSVRWPEKYSV